MASINANYMYNHKEEEISRDEMLASFLTDDALSNVTLKGNDGVEVRANRFLLAARSHVFRGMLVGEFHEAISSVVELGLFQGTVLQAVVEYILTDSAEMLKKPRQQVSSDNDNNATAVDGMMPLLVSLSEAAAYFHLPGLGKLVMDRFQTMFEECPPALPFALLQACRQVAGPNVTPPANLVKYAIKSIRKLPVKHITTKAVACLSVDVLEEILKDPDTKMTEYQLFLILLCWTEAKANANSNWGGEQENLGTTSTALSKHICLEKIDADHLATTVTNSGIITDKQLLEAFKHQALVATQKIEMPRKAIWTTTVPENHEEYPYEIKVVGAGVDTVNGVYTRTTYVPWWRKQYSQDEWDELEECIRQIPAIYIKNGMYKGSPVQIFVVAMECYERWVIGIVSRQDLYDCVADETGVFFYLASDDDFPHMPPHDGWSEDGDGVGPPPTVSYRQF